MDLHSRNNRLRCRRCRPNLRLVVIAQQLPSLQYITSAGESHFLHVLIHRQQLKLCPAGGNDHRFVGLSLNPTSHVAHHRPLPSWLTLRTIATRLGVGQRPHYRRPSPPCPTLDHLPSSPMICSNTSQFHDHIFISRSSDISSSYAVDPQYQTKFTVAWTSVLALAIIAALPQGVRASKRWRQSLAGVMEDPKGRYARIKHRNAEELSRSPKKSCCAHQQILQRRSSLKILAARALSTAGSWFYWSHPYLGGLCLGQGTSHSLTHALHLTNPKSS